MNKNLLHSIKNHTDTLIEQTKTKLQETFEFKMGKQKETFSFSPPINLVEEENCFLSVASFEAKISVFNITDKNNKHSISTPDYWTSRGSSETIIELQELLRLRQ